MVKPVSEFSMPGNLIERVVFCDFDGTITEDETFIAILREFSPEAAERLIPRMFAREITLREGVRQILEEIPAHRFQAILDFAAHKKIRKGFAEMLAFCKQRDVPFVIVSGGLRAVVELVLGDLKADVHAIYAVDVECSGPTLKAISPYEDDTELVSKVRVMREYTYKESIAIGDSLTDYNMAMAADVVFARDKLATYLTDAGKRFKEWKNFIDVRNELMFAWRYET